MKRTVALVLSAVMLLCAVPAPAETVGIADAVGVWRLISGSMDGEIRNVAGLSAKGQYIILTVGEDGTAAIDLYFDDALADSRTYACELTNGALTVNGRSASFSLKGDLLFVSTGTMVLVFLRRTADRFSPADDIRGTWMMMGVVSGDVYVDETGLSAVARYIVYEADGSYANSRDGVTAISTGAYTAVDGILIQDGSAMVYEIVDDTLIMSNANVSVIARRVTEEPADAAGEAGISDVPADHAFAADIAAAVEAGAMTAEGGAFRPDDPAAVGDLAYAFCVIGKQEMPESGTAAYELLVSRGLMIPGADADAELTCGTLEPQLAFFLQNAYGIRLHETLSGPGDTVTRGELAHILCYIWVME